MANIHNRIRQSRIAKKLSQSDLASRTGVSQPTIANWENGSHVPRPAALEKIASAMNLDKHWLQSGTQVQPRRYLGTPIRHIPIYEWPENTSNFDTLSATDYLALSLSHEAAFALQTRDIKISHFLQNTLLIFTSDLAHITDHNLWLIDEKGHFTVAPHKTPPDNARGRLILSMVSH